MQSDFKYLTKLAVQLLLALLATNTARAAALERLVFAQPPANSVFGAPLARVTVQLVDIYGANVAQSGTAITLAPGKGGGLGGTTNVSTDAKGKAVFTNLFFKAAGTNLTLLARAAGNIKGAASPAFNVARGGTAATLVSSTNFLVYGQTIKLTATLALVAPAAGTPAGTVTFKDGAATLGTAVLGTNGQAVFSTNRFSAAGSPHTLTAAYSGDGNFLACTSGNLVQNVGKLALAVSGIVASNKIYDGTTGAKLNTGGSFLSGVLSNDVVTLDATAAAGVFANASVGTGKPVAITGLALAGTGAGNYSVTSAVVRANITPRSLTITAKGADKTYDGTAKATVTLTDNRLAGDVFTDSFATAAFTGKNAGSNILINVSGLAIAGSNAANYSLAATTATAAAGIAPATLTVSGITASNKVYDGTAAAGLNFAAAKLATVFAGDTVTLNYASATGSFASKNAGTGRAVAVSGLALGGTGAGNYVLAAPAALAANITPRSLTITAAAANKVYDATTNAAVTLADNRLAGDTVTESFTSAGFAGKNAGTNISVKVYGITLAGADAANYAPAATNLTATASITRCPLTVSGVAANDKFYDGTNTATLDFTNAKLATVFAGDSVTLLAGAAKGVFAGKSAGVNLPVTISGLALGGAGSNNYSLAGQPAATASIRPRPLAITAKGLNKIYDGTTAATVTLTDNRIAGDLLTNSWAAAAFAGKDPGTNVLINVSGLAISGAAAGNYVLTGSNTTAGAAITPAPLLVAAGNLTRPYAATNPVLVWFCSGFVAGESLAGGSLSGTPALATTAKTNSPVGSYPITISQGTLASADYQFTFTNGVLKVAKTDTSALLKTANNPAGTNQSVTFTAAINPLATATLPPAGVVQFKSNGTNKLGAAIALTNGAASLTVPAASLGRANALIAAEFSDPAGNFSPSTNFITQLIVSGVVTSQPPCKLSLAPAAGHSHVSAQLAGISGQTYVIEASTDMFHWTPISTNVADVNGAVSLVDSNAAAFPSRFYRAVTQ